MAQFFVKYRINNWLDDNIYSRSIDVTPRETARSTMNAIESEIATIHGNSLHTRDIIIDLLTRLD